VVVTGTHMHGRTVTSAREHDISRSPAWTADELAWPVRAYVTVRPRWLAGAATPGSSSIVASLT